MKKNFPRLRGDLEFIPVSHQGERGVLVKDPLELISRPLFIKGGLLAFISLLDGTRGLHDIQLAMTRTRGGLFFSREEGERMLAELDRMFILDGPRYAAEKEKLAEAYRREKERKAFLAGRAYPDSPSGIREVLLNILEGGEALPEGERVRALIAPHISLDAGKGVYARAYSAIRNAAPRRVVLMGTGHRLQDGIVCFTEKNFRTPLGLVQTDASAVSRMREKAGGIAAPDDLAHRSEHSLEFQLLFLQVLFGSDFTLLPLLMGSFREDMGEAGRAGDIEGVSSFIEELAEYIEEDDQGTMVVAGVDFFHIGLKFGHDSPASSLLWEAKRHDETLLKAVERGDPRSFWKANMEVKDRFHVCGFSALACLLELFSGCPAELLAYDVWHEEETRSAVSFAAAAIKEKN